MPLPQQRQKQPQGGSTHEQKAATAAKPSVYQIVTDRIIASLKAGVIPWEKPWQTPHFAGGPFPRNFRTGKPYRGINIMLFGLAAIVPHSGLRSIRPKS